MKIIIGDDYPIIIRNYIQINRDKCTPHCHALCSLIDISKSIKRVVEFPYTVRFIRIFVH